MKPYVHELVDDVAQQAVLFSESTYQEIRKQYVRLTWRPERAEDVSASVSSELDRDEPSVAQLGMDHPPIGIAREVNPSVAERAVQFARDVRPVLSSEQRGRFIVLLDQTRSSPPTDRIDKEHWVLAANWILTKYDLEVELADGTRARFCVNPGGSGAGFIQFVTSKGSRGGFHEAFTLADAANAEALHTRPSGGALPDIDQLSTTAQSSHPVTLQMIQFARALRPVLKPKQLTCLIGLIDEARKLRSADRSDKEQWIRAVNWVLSKYDLEVELADGARARFYINPPGSVRAPIKFVTAKGSRGGFYGDAPFKLVRRGAPEGPIIVPPEGPIPL